jgi:tetrahydromethanopterin S-methyltransferase subunit E
LTDLIQTVAAHPVAAILTTLLFCIACGAVGSAVALVLKRARETRRFP